MNICNSSFVIQIFSTHFKKGKSHPASKAFLCILHFGVLEKDSVRIE